MCFVCGVFPCSNQLASVCVLGLCVWCTSVLMGPPRTSVTTSDKIAKRRRAAAAAKSLGTSKPRSSSTSSSISASSSVSSSCSPAPKRRRKQNRYPVRSEGPMTVLMVVQKSGLRQWYLRRVPHLFLQLRLVTQFPLHLQKVSQVELPRPLTTFLMQCLVQLRRIKTTSSTIESLLGERNGPFPQSVALYCTSCSQLACCLAKGTGTVFRRIIIGCNASCFR